MKAKSRRRLLISSVAMLLVAMLALGTATFAWFTTDTSTKANGISVKTTKKSLLLVSAKTGGWTDNLNYNFSETVQPASSNDGVNWYKAVANTGTAYNATNGEKIASADYNNYLFANMINVHNAGQVALNNVKYTFTITETTARTDSNLNYLRWAIVPATNTSQATRGNAAPSSPAAFVSAINDKDGADYTPVDHVGAAKTADSGAIVAGSAVKPTVGIGTEVTFNVGELAADNGADGGSDEKYYMFYIWFEGQDEQCYDSNAGNEMPTFNIAVTGDPITE
jgi:hypothetical protein